MGCRIRLGQSLLCALNSDAGLSKNQKPLLGFLQIRVLACSGLYLGPLMSETTRICGTFPEERLEKQVDDTRALRDKSVRDRDCCWANRLHLTPNFGWFQIDVIKGYG